MVLLWTTQNALLPAPCIYSCLYSSSRGAIKGGCKSFSAGKYEVICISQRISAYTTRRSFGKGGMKINFLVNYSWEWDFGLKDGLLGEKLKTAEVSRIDLIIRWGGRRRLSGFLPVQSVYSDFYVVDDYWPDFKREHVKMPLSGTRPRILPWEGDFLTNFYV